MIADKSKYFIDGTFIETGAAAIFDGALALSMSWFGAAVMTGYKAHLNWYETPMSRHCRRTKPLTFPKHNASYIIHFTCDPEITEGLSLPKAEFAKQTAKYLFLSW